MLVKKNYSNNNRIVRGLLENFTLKLQFKFQVYTYDSLRVSTSLDLKNAVSRKNAFKALHAEADYERTSPPQHLPP